MKKLILVSLGLVSLASTVFALPTTRYEQHIFPFLDSAYELGTSTNAWSGGTFDKLCLTADSCRTTWPTASMTFAWPFTKQGNGDQATSTILNLFGGLLSTSSSTVNLVQIPNLTGNGFVKTSGSNGLLSIDTTSYLTGMTFGWPWTKQAGGEQSTTTVIGLYNGFFSNASSTVNSSFLVAGSSTLQNFTASNATTTNLNITANSISFGANKVNGTTSPSFIIASSTLVNGASYNRASTTFVVGSYLERRNIVGASCVATSTGGVLVHVGGKTDWSSVMFCDNNPRTYVIGKSVAPFPELMTITVGKASTTPDSVTITLFINKFSD